MPTPSAKEVAANLRREWGEWDFGNAILVADEAVTFTHGLPPSLLVSPSVSLLTRSRSQNKRENSVPDEH